MTYEEIVAKVRDYYKDADAEMIRGHLAVQFNITGEGHGAFYLEVKDNKVYIEPYEYHHRDAALNLSASTLFMILNKETTLEKELNSFHVTVDGPIGDVLILKDIRPARSRELPAEEKRAVEEVARVKEEMEEVIAAEVLKAEAEALKAAAEVAK